MTEMHYAADAEEAITINRYAHLVGGCRMAADERSGVVDDHLRSFAVPNLFITDGSVMPTQGSANPALTIMALAARAADYLASGKGLTAPERLPGLDGSRGLNIPVKGLEYRIGGKAGQPGGGGQQQNRPWPGAGRKNAEPGRGFWPGPGRS